MSLRVLGSCVVLGLALLGSGCRTPQSLCNEYFDERNNFEDACGLPITDRELVCQMDDETTCGCGAISTVENPQDIVQDCFRFFHNQSSTCDSPRLVDYPENLPEACNIQTHFFYQD
ncbi:MAG: hypothetical protein K1X94_30530 [Sandaracinaceae bacterium]|jgi:hypothetical protein|nr:hypothetical protein [Sandaracinaceae bacterium]